LVVCAPKRLVAGAALLDPTSPVEEAGAPKGAREDSNRPSEPKAAGAEPVGFTTKGAAEGLDANNLLELGARAPEGAGDGAVGPKVDGARVLKGDGVKRRPVE
jgi:hypothetical protein